MADTKISALPASATPLAGTEVLPVVQSGATKQVSVANITAGRSVSALNLGLNGVTSPVTTLQIGASGSGTGTQDAVLLTKYSSDTAQFRWLWNYSGSGYLGIGTSGSSMIFGRATGTTGAVGATYVTLDSSGNVTANIGNFVQGTAAKGINFTANTPAAGMTSQLLNWYEEGTWTPADASGAGLTITKNGTQYYTRVGSLVTAYFDVTYPVTTNASQAVLSLPISTSKNGSGVLSYSDYTTLTVWWLIGSSGMAFYYPGGTLTNVNISGKRFVGSMTYIV